MRETSSARATFEKLANRSSSAARSPGSTPTPYTSKEAPEQSTSGRGLTYVGSCLTFVGMRPKLTPEKVRAALVAGDGSPTKAARILGVSRQTVHDWMKKKDIRVKRVVDEAA